MIILAIRFEAQQYARRRVIDYAGRYWLRDLEPWVAEQYRREERGFYKQEIRRELHRQTLDLAPRGRGNKAWKRAAQIQKENARNSYDAFAVALEILSLDMRA